MLVEKFSDFAMQIFHIVSKVLVNEANNKLRLLAEIKIATCELSLIFGSTRDTESINILQTLRISISYTY